MREDSLNTAGAAGWLLADLFLVLAVLMGSGSHQPDTPAANVSAEPSLPSRHDTESPVVPEDSEKTEASLQPVGILQESRTDLGGATGFDVYPGGVDSQVSSLQNAILEPYFNGRYGPPGIVLVFGVADGELSGTEVSSRAISLLSTHPELHGVVFRAFLKEIGDPGELHAEVYYFPSSPS